MQLGSVLSTASEPVAYKPVTFHVLRSGPGLPQTRAKAEAVLAFVDEEQRQECDRQAYDFLRAKYGDKSIPQGELRNEEWYRFLLCALRDKDNPAIQFCPVADLPKFRSALIARQVTWLLGEYGKFTDDEYPELATPEQQADLKEQAGS